MHPPRLGRVTRGVGRHWHVIIAVSIARQGEGKAEGE